MKMLVIVALLVAGCVASPMRIDVGEHSQECMARVIDDTGDDPDLVICGRNSILPVRLPVEPTIREALEFKLCDYEVVVSLKRVDCSVDSQWPWASYSVELEGVLQPDVYVRGLGMNNHSPSVSTTRGLEPALNYAVDVLKYDIIVELSKTAKTHPK